MAEARHATLNPRNPKPEKPGACFPLGVRGLGLRGLGFRVCCLGLVPRNSRVEQSSVELAANYRNMRGDWS